MQLSQIVPTAVVQLDTGSLPHPIRVADRYSRALVVLRRGGLPIATFYVPVQHGTLDADRCAWAIRAALRQAGAHWRVEQYLGARAEPGAAVRATVAVCTRERPHDLVQALTAIRQLQPAAAEVLVIDNNPATPRTREVVAAFPGVRYVREDTPGLDAARNRALRESSTPVVAFTDDDARPEAEWLGRLVRAFDDPRVWCASGLTLPLELETPAQEWFERYSPFGRGFRRQVFDGIRHDPLAVSRVGAGANMAVRTAVLHELGGFDEALDAGTPTRSGGDHEMFARILAAGYRIVYDPAAVSWHRHRRTWEELRDTLYGYGVGVYAFWTRKLFVERELSVLRHAFQWLRYGQVPNLWRAVRGRPHAVPRDLLLAELRGCFAGPLAYVRARRRLRTRSVQ